MLSSTKDLNAIELALIKGRMALDCTVQVWQGEDGDKIVAYVVPAGAFSEQAVRASLQSELPESRLPDHFVLLSTLPYSKDGSIDEEALAQFEVVDEELAKAWEREVLSLPGVQRARVVMETHSPKLKPLHISDLLPNRRAGKVADSSPAFSPALPSPGVPSSVGGKLAISHGEALRDPEQVPPTLQEALKRAAKTEPVRRITYVQADGSEIVQTYQQLLEDSQRILGGLRRLGLRPGDKVIFQLGHNQDFIAAFWACMLGGFVPAPISIAPTYGELNSTVHKLHNSWEMLGHPVILAGAELVQAVHHAGEMLCLEEFRVESAEELRSFAPDHVWHQSLPDDVALILLTSGSTGLPKGVMQSHRSLLLRSAGTAQLTQFEPTDILINWFPLDHVGGIVMSHLIALFGCASQIHVPTETILQEPLKWLDLIEGHRATVTWAPNFAFGLINDQAGSLHERQWDLSSMRFILNGGEAVVAKTARRFLQLLAKHGLRPDAIHPAWGMSETCSGVAYSERCSLETIRDEDAFVEVGLPIPGASFRIVDDRDQILDEGQIGCLQVTGAPVTSGYYKNPELNRESFSPDGWFKTGDLAKLNEGRLTITGRSKDAIIVNGANFFSHELEAVVEEVPGVDVSYTAAFAVRAAKDDTDRLCIVFHPLAQDWEKQLGFVKKIREALMTKAGVHPAYVIPVERADIPKTAIGKIQRPALRQRFEAGEFDSVVKRIDLDTGSSSTLPNWFFRKTWSAQQARIRDEELLRQSYLVFADGSGLTENLRREVGGHATQWIEASRGAEFARLDRGRYRVNPAEPEHHERLLGALAEEQIDFDCVVHLWTYGKDSEQEKSGGAADAGEYQGLYSILHFVKALAARADRPVRLVVVSSQAQGTCDQDRVACERAALLGFLKTLSMEMPLLECRHIDLEGHSSAVDAQLLALELTVLNARAEVAYRGERRLQKALAQMDMLERPAQRFPIADSGLYLISGGLGGVGTQLAKYLSREFKAKLLLVGRTVLPKNAQLAEATPQDTTLARRIRNYQELESSGADFLYRSVDICDLNGLREAVREAEERWGQPLRGVFHLAGEGNLERHWKVMDQHWVKAENIATFEWMFGPKANGTRTLFQLIENRPDVLFVAFSSVFSLFGSATSSAYSAASSFLDAYCEQRRVTSHPNTYCFNWTVWDEVGMSEAGPAAVGEAFRNMGYSLMPVSQALDSMAAALLRGQHHLAIGLDLASLHVQRQTLQHPEPLRSLSGYYMMSDGEAPAFNADSKEVRDLLGRKTQCSLAKVSPSAFETISSAPANVHANGVARSRVEPRNEIEQQIARVWREVLAVSNVGVEDKFFELGGDSLLALRAANRLRAVLGVSVSLRDLFEMPTIGEFAAGVAKRRGESQGRGLRVMAAAASSSPDELLAMISALPNEEVDALLRQMSEDSISS